MHQLSEDNLKTVGGILGILNTEENLNQREYLVYKIKQHASKNKEDYDNVMAAAETMDLVTQQMEDLVMEENDIEDQPNDETAPNVQVPMDVLVDEIDNHQLATSFLEQHLITRDGFASVAKRMSLSDRGTAWDIRRKILEAVKDHKIPHSMIKKLYLDPYIRLDLESKTFETLDKPINAEIEARLRAPFNGIKFVNGYGNNSNSCYINQVFNTLLMNKQIRRAVLERHRDCETLALMKTFLDRQDRVHDGTMVKPLLSKFLDKHFMENPFTGNLQQDSEELLGYVLR